jgi:SM-20-related protein
MDAAGFSFSTGIDRDAAARAFAERGRVRVDQVLEASSAEALYACLRHEVPWKLAYNAGQEAVVIEGEELRRMAPAQAQELTRTIVQGARQGFQYAYLSYPMVTAYLQQRDPGLLLHRLLEWLTSPGVLDAVRAITGIPELVKCDAQATCYLPGHFLTRHDDGGTGSEGRRVGYVLNLARRWQPDWGGLLQFLAPPDGAEVVECWTPRFNSLALFRVPVLHAVSCVAPFAGEPRLAVTGWFRDR